MRGFSLLNPDEAVYSQIIDPVFTLGKLTPEGTYKLPDHFLYADQRICRFNAQTTTSSNYQSIKDSITNTFSIEGKHKNATASHSKTTEDIKE